MSGEAILYIDLRLLNRHKGMESLVVEAVSLEACILQMLIFFLMACHLTKDSNDHSLWSFAYLFQCLS